MDSLTLALAHRITQIAQHPLPPRDAEAARLRLLDSIGCAFGAYEEEFCQRMSRFLAQPYLPQGPSAWGDLAPTTAENAAFASAILLRHLDLNDTVLGLTGGHPSDIIPALMTVALERGATGADLLKAIVIGYEIYCGLCQGVRLAEVGVDQALAAAMGAAAGTGFLLGLDRGQLANAISLAAVANVALFNVRMGDLSEWKACAGPNGAARGMQAAKMAGHGVTGPSEIFSGPGGLEQITGPIHWPDATEALIHLTHLKLHPVCYHGQAAVDGAILLRDQLQGATISKLHIAGNYFAHHVMGADPSRWRPTNRETADHSLPYCVATALRHGAITPQDFDQESLTDPQTLALMDRITVSEDPDFSAGDPNISPSQLTAQLSDGRELVQRMRYARGHAANPLNLAEAQAKFRRLWPASLPKMRGEQLLVQIAALSCADSLQNLVKTLSAKS